VVNPHEALQARVQALAEEGQPITNPPFAYLLGLVSGFGSSLLEIPDPRTGQVPDPLLEAISQHLAVIADKALEYYLEPVDDPSDLPSGESNGTLEGEDHPGGGRR
jgi:hypothetical protein